MRLQKISVKMGSRIILLPEKFHTLIASIGKTKSTFTIEKHLLKIFAIFFGFPFTKEMKEPRKVFRGCTARSTIFGSYFGRNDDFINSFWNLLTFTHGKSHASNQNSEKGMYIGTYVAYTMAAFWMQTLNMVGAMTTFMAASIV